LTAAAVGPGESPACVIRLRLRNVSRSVVDTSAHDDTVAGVAWRLADRFGRNVGLRALGVAGPDGVPHTAGVDLAPGAEIDALFAVDRTVWGGRKPTFGDYPPQPDTDLRGIRPLLLQSGIAHDTWLRLE
jgi:hypothetical protein